MSNAEFDIGETLRKRLEEISAKKNSIGTKIETGKVQLKNLFSTSKPIRTTEKQLDSRINDLERRRTLTSLPLSEEKDILRQMDQIKKSKIQLASSNAHEHAIQEKKGDIETLRNEMRTVTAQIAELESAIAKIDLAKRLGCATQDLETHAVDCPVEKLGEVIGKGGLNIKKLEKETGCIIDVDKIKGQVHLRGNSEVIQKGIDAIESITKSVGEQITLTSEMHSYLFGNGMDPLKQLRKDHEGVHIALSKDSKVMKIRGKIDSLAAVKTDLGGINVTMETIGLDKNEAGLVIGKNGATIKFFSDKFNVGIDVNDIKDEVATVAVVGNYGNVAGAVEAIKLLIYQNKDIVLNVVVSNLVRHKFLQDSGKMVKDVQKEVNESIGGNAVRLIFEKNGSESSSVSLLEIKSPRMHHLSAVELVKKRIADYESDALFIKIEPYMIAKFVGKGGKNIKELKKLGTGVVIEVDGVVGEVSVLTNDEATKELIRAAIEKFIAENQILKIPVDVSMMGMIFGSFGKGIRSVMSQKGVHLQQVGIDAVALKGSVENITEAAAMLRDFIASNYTVEIKFESGDANQLQRKGSILSVLEKEEGVKTYLARSRGVIEIRGLRKNVDVAVLKVKRFLFGGDHFLVLKISVPDNVIGAMIGKGGKNISKFEKDYEGAKVGMNNVVNVMTIRGEDKVAYACRGAVMKEMAKFSVIESIGINSEVHEFLSKTSNLRQITNGLPVTVTLTNSHAKLRGNYLDVPIVKAAMDELESGSYEGVVPLAPILFEKVTSEAETTTFLKNVENETKSTTQIDEKNLCLKVSAKRTDVRRAKLLFLNHVERLFPRYCSKVKVARFYAKVARDSKILIHMSAESGCDITFDHDLQMFIVQAASPEQLTKGLESVEERLNQCKELIFVINIGSSDSWLFSLLLTTYRNEIATIETSCKCKIDIFKIDSVISIVGKHDAGKNALVALIDRVKKESIFMDLPESSMPHFVGQSLKHMNNFAATHHVQIDRVKKFLSRIRIHGEESAVSNAASAVNEWIIHWEGGNPGTNVYVDNNSLAIFLDTKPTSEKNRIARDCGVKLDVYCLTSSVIIRGGKGDSHNKAMEEIKALCESNLSNETKEGNGEIRGPEQDILEPIIETPQATRTVHTVLSEIPVKVTTSIEENAVPVVVVEKKSLEDPRTKNNLQTVSKMFNFLVSDASPSLSNDAPQDPWDASTISGSVENVEEGYFRSTSGFTIRL